MCRLGLFNKKFMSEKGYDYMLGFLNQLEKSCGGHGNGIIFVDKGEIVVNFKALNLGNDIIVDALFNKNNEMPEWFLYHTRVASKGSIKDENCHPYINEDESFALMMNGTVSSFGTFGKYMGDITDTEVIFKVIDKFGIDLEVLTDLDPRFIGFKNGKVFASNSASYSGLKYIEEDGMIGIASESPTGELWTSMKEEYLWIEGNPIEKEIPTKRNYSNYGGYDYYGYSSYGGQKINGSLNGKKGYWQGSKFYPVEETCKSCAIDDLDDYVDDYSLSDLTMSEATQLVKEIMKENPRASWLELQTLLDEEFGYFPTIDGEEKSILVIDRNQVAFEDSEGNLYPI